MATKVEQLVPSSDLRQFESQTFRKKRRRPTTPLYAKIRGPLCPETYRERIKTMKTSGIPNKMSVFREMADILSTNQFEKCISPCRRQISTRRPSVTGGNEIDVTKKCSQSVQESKKPLFFSGETTRSHLYLGSQTGFD